MSHTCRLKCQIGKKPPPPSSHHPFYMVSIYSCCIFDFCSHFRWIKLKRACVFISNDAGVVKCTCTASHILILRTAIKSFSWEFHMLRRIKNKFFIIIIANKLKYMCICKSLKIVIKCNVCYMFKIVVNNYIAGNIWSRLLESGVWVV